MKKLNSFILFVCLAFLCRIILAADEFQWREKNQTIDLDANGGHIASQDDVREGSATFILDVNGIVDEAILTADNSAAAQLHSATDTLVTEYKIDFDGDGFSHTGGTGTVYTDYASFLSPGIQIKYVPGDKEVQVTLWIRASNQPDDVADSGIYSATQTLTVAWSGE